MSTKISELTSATSLTGTEEIPIVQTGTTKKATIGQIQQNTNYSTTEQIIGTWINGKPLYRKTIYVETLPNNTTLNIQHNVANVGQVVQVYGVGIYKTSGGSNGQTIPYVSSGGYLSVWFDETYLHIVTTADRSNQYGYLSYEYTKSTD